MNIFQASWIMAFIALIIVNWQLRFSYAQWPPAGVAPFDPLLPSVGTLALLFSAILVRRGLKTLRVGNLRRILGAWRTAIALGLIFMAIVVYEFVTVSDAAMATQYGDTFRLMTGFHFVHALAISGDHDSCLSAGRRRQVWQRRRSRPGRWKVQRRLWYFVSFAWMLFYVVLYWIR